jgi:hypothetical protein
MLLAGFGKKTVELRDSNLLIDLDAAIKDAKIGTQGNAIKKSDKTTTTTTIHTEDTNKTYVIEIQDTVIKWNGRICSEEELKTNLSGCQSGDTIILKDNYAEAKTYRGVKKELEEYTQQKELVMEEQQVD